MNGAAAPNRYSCIMILPDLNNGASLYGGSIFCFHHRISAMMFLVAMLLLLNIVLIRIIMYCIHKYTLAGVD